jgi:hypothetical protein
MSAAASSSAPLIAFPVREPAHTARISRWVHLVPGLTDVAFILPALLMLRLGGLSFLLADGDTGWHLRTGEWILRNGRVPTTDLFSYTMPNAPWFAWEWLWDVMFGWLHLHFGMPAVLLGSLFLICLVSALVYVFARGISGNPVIAMAVTFIGGVASSVHWLARPHLVSLLFIVLFAMILEQARAGRFGRLWLLPLLTVPWANLHGGFFVGVILVGIYAAGEVCAGLFEPERIDRRAAWMRSGRYVFAATACAASSLVNPYGYHLHAHIYQYLTEKYHFDRIDEFQSLSFHHPTAPYLFVLLMTGMAAAFWHLSRRRYTWSLLLVTWAWLALVAARDIPIYVICAAAPIALALEEMLGSLARARVASWCAEAARSFRSFGCGVMIIDGPWRVHLASAAVFVVFVSLCYAPAPPAPFRGQYSPKKFPAAAVDALSATGAGRRIFTTDTWGGYLIYRLYPRIRVFGDGRSDFYGPQFGEDWGRILDIKPGWQSQLERFAVNTVLLPSEGRLAGALKESRNWRLVYEDGTAAVFNALEGGNLQASSGITAAGNRRDRAITKTINPQTDIPKNEKD